MRFLIVDDDKSIVEAVTIGLQFQWQDAEGHTAVDTVTVTVSPQPSTGQTTTDIGGPLGTAAAGDFVAKRITNNK